MKVQFFISSLLRLPDFRYYLFLLTVMYCAAISAWLISDGSVSFLYTNAVFFSITAPIIAICSWVLGLDLYREELFKKVARETNSTFVKAPSLSDVGLKDFRIFDNPCDREILMALDGPSGPLIVEYREARLAHPMLRLLARGNPTTIRRTQTLIVYPGDIVVPAELPTSNWTTHRLTNGVVFFILGLRLKAEVITTLLQPGAPQTKKMLPL